MPEQASTLAPRHSESEWWIRLASVAGQTETRRSGIESVERTTPVPVEIPIRKRGFRLILWRRRLLSMLVSGPRIQRRLHE
jgi:hypothetical protein